VHCLPDFHERSWRVLNSQDGTPALRVPDDQIDYTDDLVYFYEEERLTGIGYDDAPGFGLSDISYVGGFQQGPARDWYPSGQLKSEAIFSRIYGTDIHARSWASRNWR
jgi:hypothetical protein